MKNHLKSTILFVFFLIANCFVLIGNDSLVQALQSELDILTTEKGIPGITFSLILPNDEAISLTSGVADLESQVPLKPSDRMLSGSIGKTYVMAVAMKLVEEGQLSLETPLSQFLGKTKWFKRLPNAATIQIKHLLNHTSGIPEYVYAPEFWATIKSNPDKSWTVAERMSYILDEKPLFEVGKGWSYADANYILLGAVIEKATRKDFYELANEYLLTPLGLKNTSPSNQRELKGLVAGYTGGQVLELIPAKVAEDHIYKVNPQFEWTGGGFINTAEDLARWIKLLNEGKVLSKASTQLMQTAVSTETGQVAEEGYGFASQIYKRDYGMLYGHSGFMPGFNSLTEYVTNHGFSIALQINTDGFSGKIAPGINVRTIADDLTPIIIKHLSQNSSPTPLSTFILVRHAEKAKDGTRDPDLTEKGKARAIRLEEMLTSAGVTHIFSTDYKRTQQTVQPLAELLGLDIQSYAPMDADIFKNIHQEQPGSVVVIAGHSNTVPRLVNALIGEKKYPDLGEGDYDNLFIVTVGTEEKRVLNLKF